MPNAMELSVWTDVRGCGCPSSSRVWSMGTACFILMKSAPNSPSAIGDMTALIICAVLRTTPFFWGKMSVFERKKCPPALLHACFSFKYDASPCTANIMLLALYVNVALLFDAA